jgi:nucleoside-diphosphate-sugar epimerase
MIVAITGGTGFIGKKLALCHLARGDEVRVLSRRASAQSGLPAAVRHWQSDLVSSADIRPFVDGADVVYHCAGEVRNTALMQRVHVEGTLRLTNAAAGRIGRWVQLSSVGAYGKQRAGVVTEDSLLNPCGTYEVTKVKADSLVANAAVNSAFVCVILRPSNVYGLEMSNRSLFNLISMIERGLFFFIGKAGASANYIHVDNVVEALLLCGKSPHASGRVYNLSDHRSMEQFVGVIAKGLGVDMPRMRLPEAPVRLIAKLAGVVPGIPLTGARIDALTGRTVYPSTRIERELGYRHEVSMEHGLFELVDHWKTRRSPK